MKRFVLLSFASVTLIAADQPWQDKQVADWSQDDLKQVMSNSPWAKTVTPQLGHDESSRGPGGGRRNGGIGIGGIGIGLPGMGRPGGGGNNGGWGGRGTSPNGTDSSGRTTDQTSGNIPDLVLRWESALPIREAELKAQETNAPSVDEDHYAIAVYGVPSRMVPGDRKALEDTLKKQTVLKRDGKKDLKPSSVEVLDRDDGLVVLYLFPKSAEISKADRRIELDGQIGRLKFAQPFYLEDMIFRGKLEL
jgi:hypothetical protein